MDLTRSSINNGNWTEWSAIWSEIICKSLKSNERAARVWFEITSIISDQNCMTRSSIATLLLLSILKSRNLMAWLQELLEQQKLPNLPKNGFFCLSFSCSVIG